MHDDWDIRKYSLGGYCDWFLICADSHQANSQGGTPLCMAAQNGHADSVETLLKHGAAVDQAHPHAHNHLLRFPSHPQFPMPTFQKSNSLFASYSFSDPQANAHPPSKDNELRNLAFWQFFSPHYSPWPWPMAWREEPFPNQMTKREIV